MRGWVLWKAVGFEKNRSLYEANLKNNMNISLQMIFKWGSILPIKRFLGNICIIYIVIMSAGFTLIFFFGNCILTKSYIRRGGKLVTMEVAKLAAVFLIIIVIL